MSIIPKFLPIVLVLLLLTMFAVPSAHSALHAADCPIHQAEYQPHPAYKSRALAFRMTVTEPRRPEDGGYSVRGEFFNFDAFDRRTKKHLSTLRLGSQCSLGASVCKATAYLGQFAAYDDMSSFQTPLVFEVKALDETFSDVGIGGPRAPYVYIFPYTGNKVTHLRNTTDVDAISGHFTKYLTDEKIFPDFSGYDVWVFSRCLPKPAI